MSVDGKISTGDADVLDVDKDYPKIEGLREGLQQYYDIEKETDIFSFNSGRVLAKVGVNEKIDEPEKIPVIFVVVDNEPHLTEAGIAYLAKKGSALIIVTTNEQHPAFSAQKQIVNLQILKYEGSIDFKDLFRKLKEDYNAERMTVQTGGTINTILVREGLIDSVLLVVAPALIGGKNTSTLMDGESLHTPAELSKIKTLELVEAKPLENSYLLLRYKVRN